MSTFQGLELAKKALYAQQSALYTTGHNIANVNTEGYSRQRVNFETTTPFPVPSRVQPQIAGQVGTGVEIGTVQRIRDQFLDMQFRAEHSRLGYWDMKQEALSRMEELLNEPSENGLSKRMDLFWQSLQDLADHPENSGARAVVAQRGLALAETFNYLSLSLQSIQADLKEQINFSVKDINSLLRKINGLNEQIQKIEPHGFLANDLYDERDRLIDQLSNYMNLKIHKRQSSPSASDIADGVVSIEVLQSNGSSYDPPLYLIDANDPNKPLSDVINFLHIEPENENSAITQITLGDSSDNILSQIIDSKGALSGLIESFGFVDDGEISGDFPEILANLDQMAVAFANEFNSVHRSGVDIESANGRNFFVNKNGTSNDDASGITAENITVNTDIVKNSDLIAASDPARGSRNGDNALNLAGIFDQSLGDLDDTSVRTFYMALIGEIGVRGQEAQSMKGSTEVLQSQIEHSRMSVSAVSLDEEISNLIKFQHAYNAAARNMTAIDELIDRIINQMGLVGR